MITSTWCTVWHCNCRLYLENITQLLNGLWLQKPIHKSWCICMHVRQNREWTIL